MSDYFKISEAYTNYLPLIQATLEEVDNFLRDSKRRPSGIKVRKKLLELKIASKELCDRIKKHQMLKKSEY